MNLPLLESELFWGGRGSRILEYSVSKLVLSGPIRKPELVNHRIPTAPGSSLQTVSHQAGFLKEDLGRNFHTRH